MNENLTIQCSTCYRQGDKCICTNKKEHMVNVVQDLCEPHHVKDISEQVFLVIGEQFKTPNQEDQGMDYSITLERQNISSKHNFPPGVHNEYNHAFSQ